MVAVSSYWGDYVLEKDLEVTEFEIQPSYWGNF